MEIPKKCFFIAFENDKVICNEFYPEDVTTSVYETLENVKFIEE